MNTADAADSPTVVLNKVSGAPMHKAIKAAAPIVAKGGKVTVKTKLKLKPGKSPSMGK